MALISTKHNNVFGKFSAVKLCFPSALSSVFTRVVCACVIFAGVILHGPVAADEVTRAERWFNKIKSIKADFVQVASDGTSAEGILLLRRPSQMKITYRPGGGGKGLQLITSKIWLHVDQPDEKLLTSYPLSETPLSLILAEKVSLRLDGYETRIKPSSSGVVQILVSKEEGEGAGQLILEFTEKPFQFRRWIVVDAVGMQTSVTLFNIAFDIVIPNVVFSLPDYLTEN